MRTRALVRKRLAMVLIAAMASSQTMPAMAMKADKEDGLYLNEDRAWTYWKDGEMLTSTIVKVGTDYRDRPLYYYFDADGVMAQSGMFDRLDIINEGDEHDRSFARRDGYLQSGWADPNGQWHYFDKDYLEVQNGEVINGGKKYYFGEDGIMLAREFREDEDGNKSYYQNYGQRADNKWLNIDGNWYYFNKNGHALAASGSNAVATDSNVRYEFDEEGMLVSETQPFPTVEGIALRGEQERTVEVGKTIKLTFDVRLASESNVARNKLTEDSHDYWTEAEVDFPYIVSYSLDEGDRKLNQSDSTYTVTYTPNREGIIEITAVIDNVESDQTAIIKSVWGENADKAKLDSMKALLDNHEAKDSRWMRSVDSLADEMENKGILKNLWMSYEKVIREADTSYAVESHIVKSNTITDAAADMLENNQLEIIGAVLNVDEGTDLECILDKGDLLELGTEYTNQKAFDLACGDQTELKTPVIVKMSIPKGMNTDNLVLHHEVGDSIELVEFKVSGNEVTFVTDSMGTFAYAEKTESGNTGGSTEGGNTGGSTEGGNAGGSTEGGNAGGSTEGGNAGGSTEGGNTGGSTEGGNAGGSTEGGNAGGSTEGGNAGGSTEGGNTGGSGSSSGGSSGGGSGSGGGSPHTGAVSKTNGVTTTDAKKGQVNSITGIITGSGEGNSKWNQDEKGWKLQYADGTFIAGMMVTDEKGNTHEQPAWELINGAWYPFGTDGYVKNGLVNDPALGGIFYIDINTGMKIGWQNIDGVWRYFNPVSDGKLGIMRTDTWIEGYYIDANGVWDSNKV